MTSTPGTAAAAGSAVLVRSVSKTFGGSKALDSVTLDVRQGEVHALLGMNGSGKSTLIKVLAGFHRPDSGSDIEIFGSSLESGSARAAHDAGLRFIHQDLGLIDSLTVEENFSLAASQKGSIEWVGARREQRRVQRILDSYDVEIDARDLVVNLSPTHRAILAIIRAVEDNMGDRGILILDEPTASLPRDEVHHLFRIVDRLKRSGTTIIYVSHRMPEILEIADRITVLRDGKTVARAEVSSLNIDTLVEMVLGHGLKQGESSASQAELGEVRIDVAGLAGGSVAQFDLRGRAGEIIGITGLLGSGYEEILALAFGALPISAGTVMLEGASVQSRSIRSRIRGGMAFAPADRRHLGSMQSWTSRENLTLPDPQGAGPLSWMSSRRERADAQPWLNDMVVVPPDPERTFATLSGGNQQKIVIGRWLRTGAKVLMLDEPTNGVDASATRTIHEALRAAAIAGACVLLASSDIEELVEVCDRVLIMRDGEVMSTLSGSELTDDELNRLVMTPQVSVESRGTA